jgi:hypothetical protein
MDKFFDTTKRNKIEIENPLSFRRGFFDGKKEFINVQSSFVLVRLSLHAREI